MLRGFGAVGGDSRWRVAVWLMTAVLMILPGCGGADTKPKPVPVKGVVTLRGKPLANARVSFYSTGASMPASGETNDAGEFTLTMFAKGDGALVGENKVTVVSLGGDSGGMTVPDPTKMAKGEIQPPAVADRPKTSETSEIPKVYSAASSTPVTWKVKPEGDPNVKLELK